MSRAFIAETHIDRPMPEVWSAMLDWDRAQDWMSGVEKVAVDGETRRGATLTFHTRGKDRLAEISDLEAGRKLTIRSVQGGVTADYTYELTPADSDATQVRLVADCETRGLVWNTMAPIIRAAIRRADSGQLEALKRIVEEN